MGVIKWIRKNLFMLDDTPYYPFWESPRIKEKLAENKRICDNLRKTIEDIKRDVRRNGITLTLKWTSIQQGLPENNIEVVVWYGHGWRQTRLVGGYFADNHDSVTHWAYINGP